jgi:NADH pyrophosphatase NudC (nudix superfamily)
MRAASCDPNPAELVDARWFGLDELPQLPGRSASRAR